MKNKTYPLLFLLTCLAILITLSACQSAPATSLEQSPAATEPPAAPATPLATPQQIPAEFRATIARALLNLYTQPNRMEVTTRSGDDQIQTNVIEFVPPDRKRIFSPTDNVEYIVIGDAVYLSSGGQWQQTQIPAATFLGDAPPTYEAIQATISQEQFVRRDQLAGKEVLIYTYASTTRSGEIELHSQTELWMGADDGLPVQMIVDGEILSAATDPATGESKMQPVQALTTSLITFDPSLKIEAPAIPAP